MVRKQNKLEKVEDLKNFLKDFFLRRGKRIRVILFGSRARGTHMEHSDVDIAIFSGEDITYDILELKEELELSFLPQKVDVIDLRKAPKSLKEEILKEGRLWIDLTK